MKKANRVTREELDKIKLAGITPHSDRFKILYHISQERDRQDELFPGQAPETPLGQAMAYGGYMLAILMEEVGEVAKALNEEDRAGIADELVHVAAVCVKWAEIELERERQWETPEAVQRRADAKAQFGDNRGAR